MSDDCELERMACELDANDNYRVLRKLKRRGIIHELNGEKFRLGLFVDVETTGLDPYEDEIIELAMVPFSYGLNGRIFEIKEPFQSLQQPKNPIPQNIVDLTGIDDKMVEGSRIDTQEVELFLNEAQLIVAHNAEFDRHFLEVLSADFVSKPWACSMSQINWIAEGVESRKLSHLLADSGLFYESHRAVDDCFAGIELLNTTLSKSGGSAIAQLLEVARRSTWRIWAENAPFELKDVLKRRGYRWNADAKSNPKAWYIDVESDIKDAELNFLKQEIYKRDINLRVNETTAYNRFSNRI